MTEPDASSEELDEHWRRLGIHTKEELQEALDNFRAYLENLREWDSKAKTQQ